MVTFLNFPSTVFLISSSKVRPRFIDWVSGIMPPSMRAISVPSLVLHLLTSNALEAVIQPYLNSNQGALFDCSLVSSCTFCITDCYLYFSQKKLLRVFLLDYIQVYALRQLLCHLNNMWFDILKAHNVQPFSS